jgi:predicted DNA repair protein MutK
MGQKASLTGDIEYVLYVVVPALLISQCINAIIAKLLWLGRKYLAVDFADKAEI